MSESGSDTSDEFGKEATTRRLRNVLFRPTPKSRNHAHSMAVEAQHLTDSAMAFVSDVTDGLTMEIPKRLQDTTLPAESTQALDTTEHQRFLRDQTGFFIEERRREIEETQRRLDQALQELALTKREEEDTLQQKVKECQQEYVDAMIRLEHQFVAQADELKMATMTQVAQYRSQCETAIEAKAKALCATLATGSRTAPPSPRSARSTPAAAKSSYPVLLHSQFENLYRKVQDDDRSSPASPRRSAKRSTRRAGRRYENATPSVVDAPVADRRAAGEASFRFADTAIPPQSSELRNQFSGSRRSFLALLESDETDP